MYTIKTIVTWLQAFVMVYVFVWYLQYKFGMPPAFEANEGSKQLFVTITDWLGLHGHENWMRLGTGSVELVASLLLLIGPTQIFGAVLAIGLMSGAIFFHLVSPLGVDPYHDGGFLFHEACAVWLGGWVILVLRQAQVERVIAWARTRLINPRTRPA